ncbi:phage terminase small subunit P27 family [Furfurilactobacillus entadae]|uniref:phage terminase small subunit P27 family n=1 Tax=Furfurilactobacillus entadae TaxID=2922307 RepID=UPI0035F0AB4B
MTDNTRADQRRKGEAFKDAQDEIKDLQLTPPAYLDRVSKQLWREIVPELSKLGLLKQVDKVNLELYCQTYSIYRTAVDSLVENNNGYVVNESGIPIKKGPQIMVISDCARTLKALGADLGLNFDSREEQVTVVRASENKITRLQEAKRAIDVGAQV